MIPYAKNSQQLRFLSTRFSLWESSIYTVFSKNSPAAQAINTCFAYPSRRKSSISAAEKTRFKDRYEDQGNFEYVCNDWNKFKELIQRPKNQRQYKQTRASDLLLDYLKGLSQCST